MKTIFAIGLVAVGVAMSSFQQELTIVEPNCQTSEECSDNEVCWNQTCVLEKVVEKWKSRYQVERTGCSSQSGGLDIWPVLLSGLIFILRMQKHRVLLIVAGGCICVSQNAVAQTNVGMYRVQRFQMAPGADGILQMAPAATQMARTVSANLSANWAYQPLVFQDQAHQMPPIYSIEHQVGATIGMTWGIVSNADISLTVPVAAYVEGRNQDYIPGVPIGRKGIEDIIVAPKIQLFDYQTISASLDVAVGLPATQKPFLGYEEVSAEPKGILEYRGPFRALVGLGYAIRPERSILGQTVGDALTYGIAAEFLLSSEYWTAIQLSFVGETGFSVSSSPLEGSAAIKWSPSKSWAIVFGGGIGLTNAYGVPAARIVSALQYQMPQNSRGLSPDDSLPEEIGHCQGQLDRPLSKVRRAKSAIFEIKFQSDSYSLDKGGVQSIKGMAVIAKALPANTRIQVEGHSDSSGPESSNVGLSSHRALAVASVFRDEGLPENAIEVRAYGSTRPKADNASFKGRTANRRVVVTIEWSEEAGDGEHNE